MEIERNSKLDPISFGPSEISPDQSIHGVSPSDIRSDLENDTDNQCHSANCVKRPKKAKPPGGKVFCYICGYPCFQNGGTIYDIFSVQCEHVLPVAALSLLSGLANGTSTKDKKFRDTVAKVKKNISIDEPHLLDYDMWAGRIIGSTLPNPLMEAEGFVDEPGGESMAEDEGGEPTEESMAEDEGGEPTEESMAGVEDEEQTRGSAMEGVGDEEQTRGSSMEGVGDEGGGEEQTRGSSMEGVGDEGGGEEQTRGSSMEGVEGGELRGGSMEGVEGAPPPQNITIVEGGGVRGSSYHWAHPICNMIKSNWPFIILCYTKYGVFLVSDDLKILLPPGQPQPTGDEAIDILKQVPNGTGFKECGTINEYYNSAISTQNLRWLLNTTLGLTGVYQSWSELWKNALLLKKGTKGIDWRPEKGGYRQLLTPDNNSGFLPTDPIFSEAFGKEDPAHGLTLKLLIDGEIQLHPGHGGQYFPYTEWIEGRIQQIKNNILIPLLKNICSYGEPRVCEPPIPLPQISSMDQDSIPRISLFSMISTTATGSRVCHNMAKLKKLFKDVSKDKRSKKINIIWGSILFEELLETSAKVIKSKERNLNLTFDKYTSASVRKLAMTAAGLSSILKKVIKSNTKKVVKKVKEVRQKRKDKKTEKVKKKPRNKRGGSMLLSSNYPSALHSDPSVLPMMPKFSIGNHYPKQSGKRNPSFTPNRHKKRFVMPSTVHYKQHWIHPSEKASGEAVTPRTHPSLKHNELDITYKIIYHIFEDSELINKMEEKILEYLSPEYAFFDEFLSDFMGFSENSEIVENDIRFNESVLSKALDEYGDQDPCLYSSLPESLRSKEGLSDSLFLEIAELNGYNTMPQPDEPTDWFIYTDILSLTPELKRKRAQLKKTKKKRKITRKRLMKKDTTRKKEGRKKAGRKKAGQTKKRKRRKTVKKDSLYQRLLKRLGY